jgi:hypothetical protein
MGYLYKFGMKIFYNSLIPLPGGEGLRVVCEKSPQ